MADLYYAFWASLSTLPMAGRAAIMIGIGLLLIWIIVRPAGRQLLSWMLYLLDWLLKLVFRLWTYLLGAVLARKMPEVYAQRYNRSAEIFQKGSCRLRAWADRLTGVKKHRFGLLISLYAVLSFLVALPNLIGPVISEEYLPYFSFAADLYQRLEAPTLERAVSYVPLIDIPDDKESTQPEEIPTEVWLSLSKRGWRGTNIREAPSEDARILTTISGDVSILYLGNQSGQKNGGWVHVRLPESEVEGWIYGTLLTEIP